MKIEKRKLEENRYLMGGGSERAIALIGEARRVGLIDPAMQIDYQDYQEMYLTLQKAMNWVPNQVQPSNGMDRLTFCRANFKSVKVTTMKLELLSTMRKDLSEKAQDIQVKQNIKSAS